MKKTLVILAALSISGAVLGAAPASPAASDPKKAHATDQATAQAAAEGLVLILVTRPPERPSGAVAG